MTTEPTLDHRYLHDIIGLESSIKSYLSLAPTLGAVGGSPRSCNAAMARDRAIGPEVAKNRWSVVTVGPGVAPSICPMMTR